MLLLRRRRQNEGHVSTGHRITHLGLNHVQYLVDPASLAAASLGAGQGEAFEGEKREE